MSYMDQNRKKTIKKTKLFAQIRLPFSATNCISYLLRVNGNANKVCFVVKRYAVRNAKIRPYAVRRMKIKQYAIRKGQWLSPLKN